MRRPVVRGGAVSLVVAGLILGCGLASFGQEQSDGWRPRKTARDGLNRNVAPWARPSIRGRHDGYYVGGGAVSGGDPRDVRREGTWGWDYVPRWTRVKLKWWHGQRFQGGGGEYRSDGKTGIGLMNLFR